MKREKATAYWNPMDMEIELHEGFFSDAQKVEAFERAQILFVKLCEFYKIDAQLRPGVRHMIRGTKDTFLRGRLNSILNEVLEETLL